MKALTPFKVSIQIIDNGVEDDVLEQLIGEQKSYVVIDLREISIIHRTLSGSGISIWSVLLYNNSSVMLHESESAEKLIELWAEATESDINEKTHAPTKN